MNKVYREMLSKVPRETKIFVKYSMNIAHKIHDKIVELDISYKEAEKKILAAGGTLERVGQAKG